jgi:RNA 2',3'-cyclic 3'-phosphodiesterase
MNSIRSFISFDTPTDVKAAMREVQKQLQTSSVDVRWESIEKFHVTVKFLGDVTSALLPKIIDECTMIIEASPQFEVRYQALGCFPNKKQPRILWIGCENSDGKLEALKNRLDAILAPLGFEVEQRKFHPHITLGRVKSFSNLNNLLPMLENLTFEPQQVAIQYIELMKSTLRPEGSVYSIIKRIELLK